MFIGGIYHLVNELLWLLAMVVYKKFTGVDIVSRLWPHGEYDEGVF